MTQNKKDKTIVEKMFDEVMPDVKFVDATPNQNKKEQWLKEFDEEFCYLDTKMLNQQGAVNIKSFISLLITDIDRDWENRILEAVGEEEEYLKYGEVDATERIARNSKAMGHNFLRSQILEKLELKE